MAPRPLWPEPYCQDSALSAVRFLTECCWTYNEASGAVELIPPHEYIELAVKRWWECKELGSPLIVEKSRRLIMSWVFRGLELWRSGLKRERGVIAGLTYPKAAEHVWRIWFLHEELRKRRSDFRLAACTPRDGNVAAGQLGEVILPNGSMITTLNAEGKSFQGSGYSWVTLEELSLYSNPQYMYAQSLRVTEGKPGEARGSVVAVTNASPNKAWHELKK